MKLNVWSQWLNLLLPIQLLNMFEDFVLKCGKNYNTELTDSIGMNQQRWKEQFLSLQEYNIIK
jgi:hypothetical protein